MTDNDDMTTTIMKVEVINSNEAVNILVLPQEILQMVFVFLDPWTTFSTSQVNKTMQARNDKIKLFYYSARFVNILD